MKKNKILSALTLAGVLTASVWGANVNATVQPVGIYKKLIDGKTVVPYVLQDRKTPITVNDIAAKFPKLELVNGNAVTDNNAIVKTGDTFKANGTEYTVVVYGDVNKDGKVTTEDALLIQKYAIGKDKNLDVVQVEAADVMNDEKITTMDALAVQKYAIDKENMLLDKLPKREANVEVTYETNKDGSVTATIGFAGDAENIFQELDGWTLSTNGMYLLRTFNESTKTSVTVKDIDGNEATVEIEIVIEEIDKKSPVISGLPEDRNLYIKINDDAFDKLVVNATDDVDGDVDVVVTGKVDAKTEGKYEVTYTATDKAGNTAEEKLTVIVDGTAPKLDVRYGTTELTNEGVKVTILADEKIKVIDDSWTLAEDGTSMYKIYTDKTDEILTVSDLAGNESETRVLLENVDIKNEVKVTYSTTEPTNGTVTVTIESALENDDKDKFQELEGWELSDDTMTLSKEFDNNVITDVVVKDLIGNEATAHIEIQNIDKTAPKAEVQFDVTMMTNGDVTVTLLANEDLKGVTTGWTLDKENPRKATKLFEANATENVEITDLAGNKSIVPVKVSNIDKTAPTLTVSYDVTTSTNKTVTAIIKADEKVKAADGWTLSEDGKSMTKEFSDNFTGDVKVYDLVGNEAVATVTITNIDKEAPVVKGFEEGRTSYKTVTPTFTEGQAILVKDGKTSMTYGSGTPITDDGSYVLTVKDAAGNPTVIEFVIDNVAPVFDTLKDVLLKNGDVFDTTLYAKDAVDGDVKAEVTITFDGKTVQSIDTTGKADGEYTLSYKAVDEAGNETTTTRKVTVDATAAKLVSLKSSNPDLAKEVTMRVEFDEEMQVLEGWTPESDANIAFTKKYTANTLETVEFKDIAGNITKVTVSINNIDTDAPSAVVSYSITEPTQEKVTATITSGEELKEVEGWTLSKDKMSMTKEYAENKTEKVTITDLAGNKAEVEVSVTNIDKVAPTGEVSYSGKENTTKDVVVTISAKEALKPLTGWTLSEDKMSLTKTYTANTEKPEEITISDLAGNEDTVTVEVTNIDRDAPEITGFVDGVSSYKTLNLTFTDRTAPITVVLQKGNEKAETKELQSGETLAIDAEGAYTLVAKDALGNEVQKLFDIDKNATKISGVENGKRYTKATPVFADGVGTLHTLGADDSIVSSVDFTTGTEVKVDGKYQLDVTDAAGNLESVIFEIDATAPQVTNIKQNETYAVDSITPVVVEAGEVKEVKLEKDGKVVEDYTEIAEIKGDGHYALTLTDDLGNTATINFVIDHTGPVVTGVEDGKEYKVVTPVFTEGTATLQKTGEDAKEFKSGTELSADGEYTLVVTDDFKNATTIKFRIDNAAPVLTGVKDGTTYNVAVTPETVDTDIATVVLTKDGKEVKEYTQLAEITGDGEYKLTVTDKAGNYTEVNFVIDTVVKGLNVTTENKGKPTNSDVLVTITADEKMQKVEGWTLSDDGKTMTKLYKDNAEEEVTIKDEVGNEAIAQVNVTGIDRVAPTATSTNYSEENATKENVTVTIVASEAIQKVEGWKLADDKVTLTKVFEKDGVEEVKLVDLAGNEIKTPVKVTVENIYKTAPVISGMYENAEQTISVGGKITLPKVTAKDEKGADVTVTTKIVKQSGEVTAEVTETEMSASAPADYTITYTATDAAGNETKVVRTIHVVA